MEGLRNPMTLFKSKYRIESSRLKGWDYASAGWYFVTFCTRGRQSFLGNVMGDDVRLSPIGEIVAEEWQRTPHVRPNVELDEWIIMPDHVHGIIIINDVGVVETPRRGVSTSTIVVPINWLFRNFRALNKKSRWNEEA